MWVDRLLSSRHGQALELAARFSEERHRVLAENVANLETPDHHTQRLDPEPFQASLRQALSEAQRSGRTDLELRGNAQVSTQPDGRLVVRPAREPAPNVLFHDGTNARLETLMADVTQNALSYELAVNLLRGHFDRLIAAIRGRTA